MNNYQAYKVMRIIESERLSERVKKIVLEGNLGSSPGQYAMIWVPKVGEIPISIAREPEGETWILVAKVGKVSSAIHSLKVGEELWVRGPYGRGFSLRNGNCCLIGGGYGISPLISLSERLKERGDAKIRFYAGFKRREEVLLEDLLSSISDELIITTEDGSYGLKGRVIELVDFDWPEAIYSAGPEAMLVEVVREALRRGIYAEVSMERLIRCSIGICGSCSLDPLGLLVCKDGPIFDARTISLSEDFGRYWRGFDGRKLHIGGESIGMLLR